VFNILRPAVGVGNPAKCNVDLLFINVLRIIWAAVPFERLSSSLAPLVRNIFDKIKVAGRAAAVFRRAATLTAEKPRIPFAGLGRFDFFDNDPMFPVVAKIVDVTNSLVPDKMEASWVVKAGAIIPH
jgi:hypothetical protein